MQKKLNRIGIGALVATMGLSLAGASHAANAADIFNQNPNLKELDWKRLFHQMMVWNIEKYRDGNKDPQWLEQHSIYYNGDDFNKSSSAIVDAGKKLETDVREKVLGFCGTQPTNGCADHGDALRADRKTAISDVQKLGKVEATNLVEALIAHSTDDPSLAWDAGRKVLAKPAGSGPVSYFSTYSGELVMQQLSDTILVVVPGFGSHTIADYTYAALVEDANRYYGRPADRVAVTDSKGLPAYVGPNSPSQFYAARPGKNLRFDVVHPMGWELGDSMGTDKASADHLADWINTLPAQYKNKKLILVGYSKGTPIAHNMVANHPEIQARTRMIITVAGVNQGALPAEQGLDSIVSVASKFSDVLYGRDVTTPPQALDFIKKIGVDAKGVRQAIMASPIGPMLLMGAGGKEIEDLLTSNATAASTLQKLENTLSPELIQTALEGVTDMSDYNRVKWNLTNLNDKTFKSPITIMNLSMVDNRMDLNLPVRLTSESSSAIAALAAGGFKTSLNPSSYSLDDIFLFFTSITGFQAAPGGLFDTQVAWLDTKSMPLDQRPIAASFLSSGGFWQSFGKAGQLVQEGIDHVKQAAAQREIQQLAADVNAERGAKGLSALPPGFETASRAQLIAALDPMSHFNVVDLGELRGTHWDVAFNEVYKPKDTSHGYFTHPFPRKSFLTALVETLSVYSAAEKSQVRGPSSAGK